MPLQLSVGTTYVCSDKQGAVVTGRLQANISRSCTCNVCSWKADQPRCKKHIFIRPFIYRTTRPLRGEDVSFGEREVNKRQHKKSSGFLGHLQLLTKLSQALARSFRSSNAKLVIAHWGGFHFSGWGISTGLHLGWYRPRSSCRMNQAYFILQWEWHPDGAGKWNHLQALQHLCLKEGFLQLEGVGKEREEVGPLQTSRQTDVLPKHNLYLSSLLFLHWDTYTLHCHPLQSMGRSWSYWDGTWEVFFTCALFGWYWG